MKKFFLALIAIALMTGVSFASVNVLSDGTNLGPAQDINITGGSVTGNGPVKTLSMGTVTTDLNVTGSVITDGTLYTGKIISDGAIYLGRATLDPCGTLGAGYVFFNNTTGEPCYCDNNHDDIKFEDGSTACF